MTARKRPSAVPLTLDLDGEGTGSSKERRAALPAVRGNKIAFSATLGRRAIAFALAGATEARTKWTEHATTPYVREEGDAVAEVVLRPLSAMRLDLSEREQMALQEAHVQWQEIDQTTLDVLVANCAENPRDRARGSWYISYDAILDARGLAKKIKRDRPYTYTSGHRSDDRNDTHRSVLRLAHMGATVRGATPVRKGGRKRIEASPVIIVRVYDLDAATGNTMGVWYELGPWTDAVALRADRRLPALALQYDPYREILESRLARLLSILIEDGRGDRAVSDIVDEIHAQFHGEKLGRQVDRFHKALDKLTRDGIIGSWRLEADLADEPLPPRNFFANWLRRRLIWTAPPRLVQPARAAAEAEIHDR